jgi:hypothetical protein
MFGVLVLGLAFFLLKAVPNERKARLIAWNRGIFDKIANCVPMRVQRAIGVPILILYLFLGGARVFESTVYGIDPRGPHALVTLIGLLFALVFGPGLWGDALKRDAERKRREIEFEKSQVPDPIADAKFRRDIGMRPEPPARNVRDSQIDDQ